MSIYSLYWSPCLGTELPYLTYSLGTLRCAPACLPAAVSVGEMIDKLQSGHFKIRRARERRGGREQTDRLK